MVLAAALGFAMRVFGMSFMLPVVNVGLALFLFTRSRNGQRRWFHERVTVGLDRLREEFHARESEPLPESVVTYRILYDAAVVVSLSIVLHMVTWMAGIDRIVPDSIGWITSLAGAFVLYLLVASRVNRSLIHAAIYHRFTDLVAPRSHSGDS